jgi:phenylalanyl-tRNA synthetase alpha chain
VHWAPVRTKAVADLTKEMLDDGSWESAKLKPVNLKAVGQTVVGGNLHPLLRVRMEFRKILIGMGFEEMPTNQWVSSTSTDACLSTSLN